jgi:hypothetical protein
LLLAAALTGCGGGKGKVSGTVTGPDGQPLPLGRIVFKPTGGGPGATAEIQDGKYEAADVPAGDNKVAVETQYIDEEIGQALKANSPAGLQGMPPAGAQGNLPPEAAAKWDEMKRSQADAAKRAQELKAKYRQIPDKFTNPDTSGLSLTVKGGNNPFNVDLSK